MTPARSHVLAPLAIAALAAALGCARDVICHGAACTPCPAAGCSSGVGVIHRSVGPGSTAPLASGAANPLRIVGSVAIFEHALPDRIGVGDALVSTFGERTTLAFVTARRSATAYELQTAGGGAPADQPTPTSTWYLYRAYTSLADAAAHVPNPGIPSALADFDAVLVSNDVVALGRTWSIDCYADAVDSAGDRDVYFERWNTSADFYLRIHAPSSSSEVGVSQRHQGVRDPTRYTLHKASTRSSMAMLIVAAQHARIEGLQLVDDATDSADGALGLWPTGPGELHVLGNLLFGNPANAQATDGVTPAGRVVASTVILADNVIVGMSRTGFYMNTYADNPLEGGLMARLYNNTISGSPIAIQTGHARVVAVNNALGASTRCVLEIAPIDPTSDHNLCSRDEVMTGPSSRSGVTPLFVDAAAGDFHLAQADVVAAGQGADLSEHPAFPFHVDFDEQLRSGAWDIGADQR